MVEKQLPFSFFLFFLFFSSSSLHASGDGDDGATSDVLIQHIHIGAVLAHKQCCSGVLDLDFDKTFLPAEADHCTGTEEHRW